MASSRVEWTDSGYIIRFGTRRRQAIWTAFRRSRPSPSPMTEKSGHDLIIISFGTGDSRWRRRQAPSYRTPRGPTRGV